MYSTSQLGREEFPNYDATVRGAISIGRRLQDPLSELVKIDPASIGVGMYQHDVKAKHLRVSLDEVVESCVNFVGVDVNTASPALLKYVSGLNQLTARRVYEHRMQNGPFRNRRQLMDVPGFGEATFVQAAGFLKIAGGDQPLDSTWIHPESYTVADRILARIDCRPEDIGGGGQAKSLAERIAALDVGAATEQLGVGELLLKDILAQLARPGRDPREDLPKPVFKKGVIKLEDLAEGMELTGTILNVVDFGAFVDIGMHDSGLVHVSQLADKFIRDPHEVVAVGDVVKVWVVGVDKDRRRVSLTMIKPGSKPDESTRGEKKEGEVRRERPEGGRAAKGKDEGQGGRRRYDRKDAEKPEGERKRTEGRRYEGRQQRGKGRQRGDERQGERREREQFQPKSKPKPFVPITDAMKTGKEAMRTFGDLAQYFNIGVPDEKQEDHRRDDHKKKNRKSPRQTGDSPKAAADSPGSVENNQEPPQQTPPPADAAAERQEAAPSLVSERVVEEQETPSAVIENVARVAEEQETPPSGESPQ